MGMGTRSNGGWEKRAGRVVKRRKRQCLSAGSRVGRVVYPRAASREPRDAAQLAQPTAHGQSPVGAGLTLQRVGIQAPGTADLCSRVVVRIQPS